MTLDEAIKHCEEKAEHLRNGVRTCQSMTVAEQADCLECANEHEQLAEWLIHYKEICEIVEHWADEDCHFTSAMSAFEKILDTFNEEKNNDTTN